MDTCNIESIQKPEEAICNIRLFIKIIRTVWKLIIMTLWPVSITTSSLGWQHKEGFFVAPVKKKRLEYNIEVYKLSLIHIWTLPTKRIV